MPPLRCTQELRVGCSPHQPPNQFLHRRRSGTIPVPARNSTRTPEVAYPSDNMLWAERTQPMNLYQAIQRASTKILRRDAETLWLHLLGQNRAWLLAHPDHDPSPELCDAFDELVARRAQHEPLQYLTGNQEFYGLPLHVTPDVLIPRPETEILVESVLAWAVLQSVSAPEIPLHLVDLGTGSGAIALALAAHLPGANITALDRSPAALKIARANADRLGLRSPRLRFLLSDLLSALADSPPGGNEPAGVDAIVSNPPYVSQGDAATLQPEVRDFEPHLALFAGADGLDIYRRLIPEAWAALRPAGLLALEFCFGQKAALEALLRPWRNVRFLGDLAGIPRVALAERP